MPIIYIIAGPPGVGKSTNTKKVLPELIQTLNHDKLNAEYKYRQVIDYEERANLRANAFIKENLLLKADFGIELNLGSDGHYDFLRWVKKFHYHYQIHVILFFTNDLQLCLDRALLREQAGGHSVEPAVIRRMYQNTFGLLRQNITLVAHLQFIDVTYNRTELVYSGYYPAKTAEFAQIKLPQWLTEHFPEI
jgi:predicted ABC-type ATPase